ncbi:MAG: S-methyl-5-thioribose-1-phosphate isomerase, partial [Anaerolineae bacterium]
LPTSTFDWSLSDGVREIPIEERSARELSHTCGLTAGGTRETVRVAPDDSPIANHAFDVTPARLVSALVTEYGIYRADATDLRRLQARVEQDRQRDG